MLPVVIVSPDTHQGIDPLRFPIKRPANRTGGACEIPFPKVTQHRMQQYQSLGGLPVASPK